MLSCLLRVKICRCENVEKFNNLFCYSSYSLLGLFGLFSIFALDIKHKLLWSVL